MRITMKCPHYDATRAKGMEKSSANVATAESKEVHIKTSPVKEPFIKPQCPPAAVTTLFFPLNDTTGAIHNKENSVNSREHDGTLDEGFEDSGYLSLHNSRIDDHHGDEGDDHIHEKPTTTQPPSAAHRGKIVSPNHSPSKCQRTNTGCQMPLVAASTPVDRPRRRLQSSTPSNNHNDTNLPILKFQRDVCEKLAEGYRKNKSFDWSIVTKIAEDHLLDRVIGGHMGLEYVDMFASLLSMNIRSILANILALLGDMDLISCKKVSRTWRQIIYEDKKARNRCREAEEMLKESMSPLRRKDCGLTRDMAISRVVLSCMQSRASTSTAASSSSTSQSCRVTRRTPSTQKGPAQNAQCTRFNEFIQAAGSLKQHESLRSCKRCGSPATHSSETQRAICTRTNCLFDFCTCCQEAYHGSTPCRTVQPRPHFLTSKITPILPGSARSKRNIRRL